MRPSLGFKDRQLRQLRGETPALLSYPIVEIGNSGLIVDQFRNARLRALLIKYS